MSSTPEKINGSREVDGPQTHLDTEGAVALAEDHDRVGLDELLDAGLEVLVPDGRHVGEGYWGYWGYWGNWGYYWQWCPSAGRCSSPPPRRAPSYFLPRLRKRRLFATPASPGRTVARRWRPDAPPPARFTPCNKTQRTSKM